MFSQAWREGSLSALFLPYTKGWLAFSDMLLEDITSGDFLAHNDFDFSYIWEQFIVKQKWEHSDHMCTLTFLFWTYLNIQE